jgi:hypothetical protein
MGEQRLFWGWFALPGPHCGGGWHPVADRVGDAGKPPSTGNLSAVLLRVWQRFRHATQSHA